MEGLPFKLLITSIIMAVVLPLGYSAYSNYDEGVLYGRVSLELERLADVIVECGKDPGNVRTIGLDLSDSTLSGVDYVQIGGETGTGMDMLIRFSVEGRSSTIVLENTRASARDGGTLELAGGLYDVRVESVVSDGRVIVLVEAVA